ncbi:MAG: inovirus Gp2 family protein [Pseudomonadales bacterium]|nr:inovirus Gp2 family protein [Pseudomonadales bacterium]
MRSIIQEVSVGFGNGARGLLSKKITDMPVSVFNNTQETGMKHRHPHNPNLTLIEGTEWNGLPLLPKHSPYIEPYLERTLETMKRAVDRYRRTTAIRFDLRIPADALEPDSNVISRFFESLQAKVNAHQLRKARQGQRVRSCELRYVWVREQNSSHHRHYHCCILLNGDAYRYLGAFSRNDDREEGKMVAAENMAGRIRSAWCSALRLTWTDGQGLVHFPPKRIYHIDVNSTEVLGQYVDLFRRLSYFAKASTKCYGDGSNSFGCSRR